MTPTLFSMYGIKCPAGTDVPTVWHKLLAGGSSIGAITRFDTADLPVRFGGEVPDFDPAAYLGAKDAQQTDRATQLGFAAARDALDDARLVGPQLHRCGVVAGTGLGGLSSLQDQSRLYLDHQTSRPGGRCDPFRPGSSCRPDGHELLVDLGEQGRVAVHDPAGYLLVARPAGVLYEFGVRFAGRRGGDARILVHDVSGALPRLIRNRCLSSQRKRAIKWLLFL